jgi:fatty acid desaturase
MTKVFRHSNRDAVLPALALLQGALAPLLLRAPPAACWVLIAVALWWNSNTISHIHLHNPLFRARWLSRLFSLYLTLLLAVPQELWRERHLWHHAGEPAHRGYHPLVRGCEPVGARRRPLSRYGRLEIALVALSWGILLLSSPGFFLGSYLPGYLLGMGLCLLQGHYEHAGLDLAAAPGISYYGALYNLIWFNDGYHAEHHRHPGEHWSRLPVRRAAAPVGVRLESPLPPVLRWLSQVGTALNQAQAALLCQLERLALRPGPMQRFMLRSHEQALRALLPALADRPLRRIAIIGGGLFPRTALVLRRLLPQSELTIVDRDERHLAQARQLLGDQAHVRFRRETFDASATERAGFDLLVVPLGFAGDRDALYRRPPGPVLIHDWLWRRRGQAGVVVSRLLLKRLNLVRP